MEKSPDAFRTISEVADHLETPAHVLRFWESRFPQIRPVKRAGGRRYYRPSDVALLEGIRRLLHDEGMTIRGVQKILREQGVRFVAGTAAEVDQADGPVAVSPPPAKPAPVRRPPSLAKVIDLPLASRTPGPVTPDTLPGAVTPAPVSDPVPDAAPESVRVPGAEPAPAQLALFADSDPAGLPPATGPDPDLSPLSDLSPPPDDAPAPSVLQRLRRLPPGALSARAAAITPLAARLRAAIETRDARLRDPRL